MFCVFQELSSCTCRSCFCSMVENLPATTSFIIFTKILLCVRSIPWYSSSSSFNSRAIFCSSVVASLGCMAVNSSPFWTVGKKLSQGQIAKLKIYKYIYKFFRRSFCIQNKAQNLSTSKFENFSLRRSTQQYIQISNVAIILNYIRAELFDKDA